MPKLTQPRLTRRQQIKAFLEKQNQYVAVVDIYRQLKAKTPSQKTAIRIVLWKGMGKDFVKHPDYVGFYKAI